MKIKDTINFIESLIDNTKKKSEIKFYKIFNNVLLSLENKKLNKDKIILIENKLEELNLTLNQEKRVKYIKWKFNDFTKFLAEEFSFIQQWHYVSLGMVFWMVFGLAIASSTWFEFWMGNETTGGLIGGMMIGILVGIVIDSKAKKENRVLSKK